MDKLGADADAMIQKYGSIFKRDYGWASDALGITDVSFAKVEAAIDMAHWRPFFRLACQSIHAGSQSLNFCISAPWDDDGVLLAGRSNAGLADPGHSTAVSLTLASVALFTFHPNLDSLISCKCMQQVCEDIGEELFAAHEKLEATSRSDSKGDADAPG
jgi:hypothetical protein